VAMRMQLEGVTRETRTRRKPAGKGHCRNRKKSDKRGGDPQRPKEGQKAKFNELLAVNQGRKEK